VAPTDILHRKRGGAEADRDQPARGMAAERQSAPRIAEARRITRP
jgi:hypothetical protein